MRALALLLAATVGLSFAGTAEAAPKVAVVDLVQAIQDHPRTKMVEDNLRKAQQEAQEEAKRQQERIDTLKAELDTIEEGNPKRLEKEKHLLQLQNAKKFNFEWAQVVAVRDYVTDLEQVYAAVRAVVGQIARERGHEVVLLKTDPTKKLNSTSPEDFALKSRLRVVVYSDATCDITDAVIAQIKGSAEPPK
ncbi:MAG: OmpH family outer membrane protein [Planctomycetota bacterium]|nr:OmpH family outer membrane protein [Planctomycetota bacterium]